jgi:hypothetical protein
VRLRPCGCGGLDARSRLDLRSGPAQQHLGESTVIPSPRPEAATSPLADLVRAGAVDAELAATVGVLVSSRVPVVVAGPEPEVTTTALALLASAPADLRRITVAGANETFQWMPQATELGWTRPPADPPVRRTPIDRPGSPVRPDDTILVAGWTDLARNDPSPTERWGEVVRITVRAASIGFGLVATIQAASLEDLFVALRRAPARLTDDELSHIGIVLVQDRLGPAEALRIVAAHYVRPIARDEHGHVQRLGPAVLATWDPGHDRFEHFGWGITPELARRAGMRAGDLELAIDERRAALLASAR